MNTGVLGIHDMDDASPIFPFISSSYFPAGRRFRQVVGWLFVVNGFFDILNVIARHAGTNGGGENTGYPTMCPGVERMTSTDEQDISSQIIQPQMRVFRQFDRRPPPHEGPLKNVG